jgi:branched-chain amino acid transport system substrate-binding protein
VTPATLFGRITTVDDAGPVQAEGLVVVAPFYWDANDRTRRFARRWSDRMEGRHATGNAAAVYAATLCFLRAAKAADDVDADKVLPELKRAPLKDSLLGAVTIQSDGQAVFDFGVYRVKAPSRIQQRWAYYDRLAETPGRQVFAGNANPGGDAGCAGTSGTVPLR